MGARRRHGYRAQPVRAAGGDAGRILTVRSVSLGPPRFVRLLHELPAIVPPADGPDAAGPAGAGGARDRAPRSCRVIGNVSRREPAARWGPRRRRRSQACAGCQRRPVIASFQQPATWIGSVFPRTPDQGAARAAVTTNAAYPMVKLPPTASIAVPMPASSASRVAGGNRL